MVPSYRAAFDAMGVAARVIIVLRSPAQVAASLHRRNQISPDYAGFLWARHMLEAERATRDLPRIVLRYDQVISDWREPATRIRDLLAEELSPAEPDAAGSPIRPELRRHTDESLAIFSAPLAALLAEMGLALADLGSAASLPRLDRLAEDLGAAAAAVEDALAAEFCCLRLTSPYHAVAPPDPQQERLDLAAAFGRIHRARWDTQAEPRSWRFDAQ